jgi:hypothetical protein
MRTVSKKSQKLNNYLIENPDAKAGLVAKLFKVSVQSVYQRKAKLKSAATKDDWKTTWVGTSNKSVRQKPSTLAPNAVASMALYADDKVNSPSHYKVGGIETIDFIEAKQLDYHLGNVVKYISRADHKDDKLENLKKAQWYLNRAVANLSKT